MSAFHNNGISYTKIVAVTPNDTTELDFNAFIVTVAGTVSIKTKSMASNVDVTCLAGVIYPIGGKAVVVHTDSTATGILALT